MSGQGQKKEMSQIVKKYGFKQKDWGKKKDPPCLAMLSNQQNSQVAQAGASVSMNRRENRRERPIYVSGIQ